MLLLVSYCLPSFPDNTNDPLDSMANYHSQLEAIKQTKVDLEVYLGNYVVPEDITPYTRQRDAIKDALQTYGADHVAGITVGNEFMLKYAFYFKKVTVAYLANPVFPSYLTAHSSKEPDGPIGQQGIPAKV